MASYRARRSPTPGGEAGVAELLLWESDYVQMPPGNAATVEAMRRHSGR